MVEIFEFVLRCEKRCRLILSKSKLSGIATVADLQLVAVKMPLFCNDNHTFIPFLH